MASTLKTTEIKLEEVCRTCLSKEIELHSVFDVCIGTITLDYVVAAITGVKVLLELYSLAPVRTNSNLFCK